MTTLTHKRQRLETATLDFGSVGSQASAVLPVTIRNVQVGDAVFIGLPATLNAVASQGTLTLPTIPTDGDTMTIDTKVYTFQDTLTNVDGNIFTGGSLAQAKLNIVAALNLSGTPGTDYALAMTVHPTVFPAAAFVVNDLVLTAKVPGTAGDAIATTETFTPVGDVFDAATLGTTTAGLDASSVIVDGFVSAEHTVQVRAINAGAAAVDPVAGDFDVIVWQ